MLIMALAVGFVLTGCDTGTGGGDNSEAIMELPSFSGTFVANEQEATTLATGADSQIQAAIAAALAQGPSNSLSVARAVTQSGHYVYNGVSLDYTVSMSDNFGQSYPSPMNAKDLVTITGTYGGYTINGIYNLVLDYTYTNSSTFTCKYKYDCVYMISYNGKGMKVITTGDMTLSTSGGYTYTYNLHYAVYDNNNVERYNYNYKY
jgi:hypothetical protein